MNIEVLTPAYLAQFVQPFTVLHDPKKKPGERFLILDAAEDLVTTFRSKKSALGFLASFDESEWLTDPEWLSEPPTKQVPTNPTPEETPMSSTPESEAVRAMFEAICAESPKDGDRKWMPGPAVVDVRPSQYDGVDEQTRAILETPADLVHGIVEQAHVSLMTPDGWTDEMVARRQAFAATFAELEMKEWPVLIPLRHPSENGCAKGSIAYGKRPSVYADDRRSEEERALELDRCIDDAAIEFGNWVTKRTESRSVDAYGKSQTIRRFHNVPSFASDKDGSSIPAIARLRETPGGVPEIAVWPVYLRPNAPQRDNGFVAMLVVQYPPTITVYEKDSQGKETDVINFQFPNYGYRADQTADAWRESGIVCYLTTEDVSAWCDRVKAHRAAAWGLVQLTIEAGKNAEELRKSEYLDSLGSADRPARVQSRNLSHPDEQPF